MHAASARRDGAPRRARAREGQETIGVSPKAKRPMPVPEVDDPDMSSGDMSVTELAQAVRQLQAQQAAVELCMQAMTTAVDDYASSLEGAAKEILGIHGAHTQLRTELQQGLETAEAKIEAAMAKLGGILDGMQATDAATAAAMQARTDALEQSLAALRLNAAGLVPVPGYAGPAPRPPYSAAAVSAKMDQMVFHLLAIEQSTASTSA